MEIIVTCENVEVPRDFMLHFIVQLLYTRGKSLLHVNMFCNASNFLFTCEYFHSLVKALNSRETVIFSQSFTRENVWFMFKEKDAAT